MTNYIIMAMQASLYNCFSEWTFLNREIHFCFPILLVNNLAWLGK